MATLLGIDLGGTKLALAVFSTQGRVLFKKAIALEKRTGTAVGALIREQIEYLQKHYAKQNAIQSIGIAVPGISRRGQGTVWAPNIEGWEAYPLLAELQSVCGHLPVTIESDRSCYILGEMWQGVAQGCKNAIYLAVGTGIGAGIVMDGQVLQGADGIAGAIGWMALSRPFKSPYKDTGCFEYHASGSGLAHRAQQMLMEKEDYNGILKNLPVGKITAQEVFTAHEQGDTLAAVVVEDGIAYWGMAVANLVSLFNPQKIILGGGVFGPALKWIPQIRAEAAQWAQPISMQQVSIEASGLGCDAGVYGAGFLALQSLLPHA